MRVGEELAVEFAREFAGADVVCGGSEPSIDLGRACASQLIAAGLEPGNVHSVETCTACSVDYFSYRRDASCGRQGTFVAIGGDR
jgi:copper oxidase (laccase) domain-containing protein